MTKYYYNKKRKVAYTLTELIVVSILLMSVGGIVSKEAISTAKRRDTVEKVQNTYHLLEKAAWAWQSENNCTENIQYCIQQARNRGQTDKMIFNGIAKYLPVINSSVDIEAKGRLVKAERFSEIDWLPEYTKTYDGNIQPNSSMGVSKYYDGKNYDIAYYRLRNDVTIVVNFADHGTNTGFGFFDIDGKEGENRIGIDVFPFSIGADIDQTNSLYEVAAKNFNPYFSSNNYDSFDLCNLKKDTCTNEKLATNPTVYVLKQNKLP